jgi:hypothetical protein
MKDEDNRTESCDSEPEPKRRNVLQAFAAGTALTGSLTAGTGVALAATPSDDDSIHTEPLSNRAMGKLRGQIHSSSAFKTVRGAIRKEGYKIKRGDVVGKRVINDKKDYERNVLKLPCEFRGQAEDDRTRGAVMFAHTDDTEIFVRCISQCEGEPVYIRECTEPADDHSRSGEDDMFTIEIPTAGGE